MQPLIVSAFFDIGRGDWSQFRRSSAFYIDCFKAYTARLPAKRYLIAPPQLEDELAPLVDYFDPVPLKELPAYQRYIAPTRDVMSSPRFLALFRGEKGEMPSNPEVVSPEYNIVMLAKWDAMERARARAGDRFTHLVWADFGLGRRAAKRPYLPAPRGVSPIARDKVVLSADRDGGISGTTPEELIDYVRSLSDQVAGSVMVVPAGLLDDYGALVRGSYEMLLDAGLATDDQAVVDICVRRRPEMFHLSRAPLGLTKYNHIHNVLNGLDRDVQPEPSWLASVFARPLARARIGLPMEFRLR